MIKEVEKFKIDKDSEKFSRTFDDPRPNSNKNLRGFENFSKKKTFVVQAEEKGRTFTFTMN